MPYPPTLVAAAGGGGVRQYASYYPYGLRITASTVALSGGSSTNEDLYNGKELTGAFNLNWYHYGARFYDVAVARWTTMDPADEFNSPYVYVGGDPVNLIDPDGQQAWVGSNGEILEYREGSRDVYLGQDDDAQLIGELGGTIDANVFFKNTLDDNISKTEEMWDPRTFRDLVTNGGDWDFKSNKETIYGLANTPEFRDDTRFKFQGDLMRSEDIGNFHYGATGKAFWLFGEKTLLVRAGLNQMSGPNRNEDWINYRSIPGSGARELLPPYGDDPIDQSWIKKGFEYYDQTND